tara:strand:+ start:321 stop:536 length:216 start_codon:yes stop_codon:yes gene_type:complete
MVKKYIVRQTLSTIVSAESEEEARNKAFEKYGEITAEEVLENTLDLSMSGKPNERMFDNVKRCNFINDDIK